MITRTSSLLVLFLLGFVGHASANDDWTSHPEWSGNWNLVPEVSELLGFSRVDDNSGMPTSMRIGFFISKEAALDVIGKDIVGSSQQLIEKMGHKIVAAGRYRDPVEEGSDSICFVSTKAGASYLWLGDQSKTASVAKLHFVRGASPAKDLLILDFGGIFTQRMRGPKGHQRAIGYGRPRVPTKSK
jgi:hypothetical protein